jgi:hypothetical protein
MKAHEEKGVLEKHWKPKVYRQKVIEEQEVET